MKIEIKDLTFNTIIGLLDFERVKEQRVVIDISIEYSYSKDNFINYADVANIAKKRVQEGKFKLLEDAIIELKSTIIKVFPDIKKLFIKIAKPDILDDCIVSLSEEWRFE